MLHILFNISLVFYGQINQMKLFFVKYYKKFYQYWGNKTENAKVEEVELNILEAANAKQDF